MLTFILAGTNSSLRVRTLVELCCAFIINDIQASQISSHKRKHSGDPQLDLYSIKQIVQETYVDKLPLELVDKLVRVLPWEECCNCKQLFEEHEMYIFYRDEGELSMYVDRLERVSFQRDGSYRVTHGGIVACKSCYEYVLEVINNRKEKKCTC